MHANDQARLTDALLPAVLAAAQLEVGYFKTGCAVETKADATPVTIADQQAEALLVAALRRELPALAIVAEEAFAAGDRPALTEPFLLVDALDGTKQFVSGHPEFTINIALVASGVPVYGLVYAPALARLLVTRGAGHAVEAHLPPSAEIASLDAAAPTPLAVKPRVGRLVALQSRKRNFEPTSAYLDAFPVAERRQLGSSYKFALIASGEADLYPQLGDTREWDTAAGHAILVAAGGVVTALDGSPLTYGHSAREYLNPAFIAASAPINALRASA